MSEGVITKPEIRPVIVGLCNLLLWGGVGYFLMGQKRKAIGAVLYFWLASTLTVGLGAFVVSGIFAYDSYQLAKILARGETIKEHQNAVRFLDKLPFFHSTT